MKRFTKSGFANALQVIAVILLFSYAGHSPVNESKEMLPVKTSVSGDTARVPKPNVAKFLEGLITNISLKQKVTE